MKRITKRQFNNIVNEAVNNIMSKYYKKRRMNEMYEDDYDYINDDEEYGLQSGFSGRKDNYVKIQYAVLFMYKKIMEQWQKHEDVMCEITEWYENDETIVDKFLIREDMSSKEIQNIIIDTARKLASYPCASKKFFISTDPSGCDYYIGVDIDRACYKNDSPLSVTFGVREDIPEV